jgi:hypothetical protein
MVAGILGIIGLVIVHLLVTWWEDEHIDSSSAMLSGSGTEAEVNRGTQNRKRDKKIKLEAEARRLNEEHPDRLFYRDGPRVKEYTSEEAATIWECERLNAQYAKSYPHYCIRHRRVEFDEERVNHYKFDAKMRELNNDHSNGINCELDRRNMKLINKNTKEEVPFDPDSFTLPPSHFSS